MPRRISSRALGWRTSPSLPASSRHRCTFGVKVIRMSSPVRSAPAIGPGTTSTKPRPGRAIDGVTIAASRRSRSASPPAQAGSLSARWCGSASALTGSRPAVGQRAADRVLDRTAARPADREPDRAGRCRWPASDSPATQPDPRPVRRAPAAPVAVTQDATVVSIPHTGRPVCHRAGDTRIRFQQLAVRRGVRPGDVVGTGRNALGIGGRDEVVQHVADGDRVDRIVHPLRDRDHRESVTRRSASSRTTSSPRRRSPRRPAIPVPGRRRSVSASATSARLVRCSDKSPSSGSTGTKPPR